MPDKYAPCTWKCCRTPQGVCARKRVCRCHTDYSLWSSTSPTGVVEPAKPKPAPANATPLFQEPK